MSDYNLRLIAASFVAPMASAIIISLAMTTGMSCSGAPGESCIYDPIGAGLMFGGYLGLLLGVPAMVFIGLPMHAGLTRYRQTSPIAYLFAGALAGVLTGGLAALVLPQSNNSGLVLLTVAAGAGALASAIFWLIRRPDRAAANPPTSPS